MPEPEKEVKTHETPPPVESHFGKPVAMSKVGSWKGVCVFCHKEYEGKQDSCPHCKKKLPGMAKGF